VLSPVGTKPNPPPPQRPGSQTDSPDT
jgi:hypothetical protein